MPSLTRAVNEWIAIADELPTDQMSATSLRDKVANTTHGATEAGGLQLTLDISDAQARLVFEIEDRLLYPGRYAREQTTTRAHNIEDWRVLTRTLPRGDTAQVLHRRIDAECEMARRAGKRYLQLAVTPRERGMLDIAEARADQPITHAIIDHERARRRDEDENKRDAKSDGEQPVVAKAVCDKWLHECRIEATAKAHMECTERIDQARHEGFNEGMKHQREVAARQGRASITAVRDEMADRLAAKDAECRERVEQAREEAIQRGHESGIVRMSMAVESARENGYAEGHEEGYRAAKWACVQEILLDSKEPAGTSDQAPDDDYDAYDEARKRQDLEQNQQALDLVRRQYQLRAAGQILYCALVVAVLLIVLAPAIAHAILAIKAALQ